VTIKNNLVLIGMPAREEHRRRVLAKTLGYAFVDTDILLSAGCPSRRCNATSTGTASKRM
jgi:hypothetical protein